MLYPLCTNFPFQCFPGFCSNTYNTYILKTSWVNTKWINYLKSFPLGSKRANNSTILLHHFAIPERMLWSCTFTTFFKALKNRGLLHILFWGIVKWLYENLLSFSSFEGSRWLLGQNAVINIGWVRHTAW